MSPCVATDKLPKVWQLQAEAEINRINVEGGHDDINMDLQDELKAAMEDCDEHADVE